MGNWDVELELNKNRVKTELVNKRDVINLIGELNAISFYEANEHSRECYYDIRNAVIAMQPVASCSDAISRQGLLDTIDRFCDLGKRQLKEIVRDLPPVTPKQRTGRWVYDCTIGYGHITHHYYHCSECGCSLMLKDGEPLNSFKWCSSCGAMMQEEEE